MGIYRPQIDGFFWVCAVVFVGGWIGRWDLQAVPQGQRLITVGPVQVPGPWPSLTEAAL
jgi:hypothetical protein